MKNTAFSALCAIGLLVAPPAFSQDAAEPIETQEAAGAAPLNIQPADTQVLETFLWTNRVLIVFADSPLDPNFAEQIDLLMMQPDALTDRDVIVLTDTDPAARGAIRTKLRPRGFALVIVDKDGRVMLRKPAPWDLREITRAIDKTPIRQRELLDERRQIDPGAPGTGG